MARDVVSEAMSHNRTAAVLFGLPLSAQPWAQLYVAGHKGTGESSRVPQGALDSLRPGLAASI